MKEHLFSIDKKHFRVESFRAGGKGGQKIIKIKQIEEYPDYFVSSNGKVLSNKKGKLKRLKLCENADGYYHVRLSNKKIKGKTIKVHHLVAETFIEKRPEGLVCCHNDGNNKNNNVENLRWDTIKSNVNDTIKHGKLNPPRGSKNGMSKLTDDDVIYIKRTYKKGIITHKQIANKFNISREQVRDIINNKYWNHIKIKED